MDFIRDIIIFIVSLSVLVVIHELGHFLTAKAFGVYCREFSIGMGPLLFKHKRKGGETQFSIRCVPLGGFVSMVGEDAGDNSMSGGQVDPNSKQEEELTDEDREILALPKERRLNGIKRWKRAIIMAAGVIMNVVLAFILFICTNVAVDVIDEGKRTFASIESNSLIARETTIKNTDEIIHGYAKYVITDYEKEKPIIREKEKELDIKNGHDLYAFISTDYAVKLNEEGNSIYYSETDHVDYVLTTSDNIEHKFTRKVVKIENSDYYALEKFGVYFNTRKLHFDEVMSHSFDMMKESSLAIYKALGMLFTPEGISQVGGPVAIFQVSSQAVSMGAPYFLYLWGMISINLAIMNFLPIPGLDGWHFLVLIFEGITKKEMPSKAKNIASSIGLLLLFGLMILVTIKDIIGLF